MTVAGVVLAQDTAATASRRRTDAEAGAQDTALTALARLGDALGLPEEAGSLAGRAAAFETALLAAANDPSADAALGNAVAAAGTYAKSLSSLSTETQRLRMDADATIAQQVETVNRNLKSIEAINREIRMLRASGGDAAALINERNNLIDSITSILPINAVNRSDGSVALYTAGGATLLDGSAAELGFVATPTITQDMTLASGALSGLTLNGRPVSVEEGSGGLGGGSLGALFTLRDDTLPRMADQLDALAEDLVLRFQDSGVDPTLAPGDPGLFTDGGAAYDPADLAGLAMRLQLFDAVDPAAGGEVWRLRDGLAAAAPGETGDAGLLSGLYAVAVEPRVPGSAMADVTAGSLSGLAAALTDGVAAARARAEEEMSYVSAIGTALAEAESAATGVNTDAELQRLLLVEQSYAANARVISAVDRMISALMEI